jgi:hypothetical protein
MNDEAQGMREVKGMRNIIRGVAVEIAHYSAALTMRAWADRRERSPESLPKAGRSTVFFPPRSLGFGVARQ